MVNRGRCRLCGEVVAYDALNPVQLGRHLVRRHPNVSVDQFSVQDDSRSKDTSDLCDCLDSISCPSIESLNIRNAHSSTKRNPQADNITKKNHKDKTRSFSQPAPKHHREKTVVEKRSRNDRSPSRAPPKHLYSSKLETWRPGSGPITCPKCGHRSLPLVQANKNNFSDTPLGAFCAISCLPFCFMFPLICGPRIVKIYCRRCGNILGEYNEQCGEMDGYR